MSCCHCSKPKLKRFLATSSDEKFKFNNGKVRKQEQQLYIEDLPTVINMAQEAGFLVQGKVDLVNCAYEYQYLYILVKPQ